MAFHGILGAGGADRDRYWHRATIAFLAVTSLIRLCLLPQVELAADEAYYWEWSRRLGLGYYDQGPFIAYLIRLTTTIFGTNEFGVRFGVWAVSVGTLICVYVLTRRFASARAGFLAVLFLALTPLVTAGSLVATYDPPLVFFWALALVALERALFASDDAVQSRAWALAGVFSGLGLLSKHTMLLIVPCLLLFLALSPAHRQWLRQPQPYLAFLITISMYSGVLWWNAHHHWYTFGHLLFLVGKDSGTVLSRFGSLIGGQAVLVGPGLFIGCLAAFRSHWKNRRTALTRSGVSPDDNGAAAENPAADGGTRLHDEEGRPIFLFLGCFGLPVLAFFCLMILKAKVQANWAPCAWLTPTIALAMVLAEGMEQGGASARRAVRQTWAIALTSGILTLLLLTPWLRLRLGIRQAADDDISNKTYGARRMATEVDAIRSEMQKEGRPVFVAANDYQTCSLLAFYLPVHPRTYLLFLDSRLNNYAVDLDDLKLRLGENAVFAHVHKNDDEALRVLFERVEWSDAYPLWRRPFFDRPIRNHYYGRCYNFHRFIGTTRANGG